MNQRTRPISFFRAKTEPKGWGSELKIINHTGGDGFPLGYSGKLLIYQSGGASSSMHYHALKHETFYVVRGKLLLQFYDLEDAELLIQELHEGDGVIIPPMNPHRLSCLSEDAVVIEFASADYATDNYRIAKGDSQCK